MTNLPRQPWRDTPLTWLLSWLLLPAWYLYRQLKPRGWQPPRQS